MLKYCLNARHRCNFTKANAFFLTSHQIKLVRQMSKDINEKKIKMWFTFHYYFIVFRSVFEKFFICHPSFLFVSFLSYIAFIWDITLSSFYHRVARAPVFRRHLISYLSLFHFFIRVWRCGSKWFQVTHERTHFMTQKQKKNVNDLCGLTGRQW